MRPLRHLTRLRRRPLRRFLVSEQPANESSGPLLVIDIVGSCASVTVRGLPADTRAALLAAPDDDAVVAALPPKVRDDATRQFRRLLGVRGVA